jgi:hypothetical protein
LPGQFGVIVVTDRCGDLGLDIVDVLDVDISDRRNSDVRSLNEFEAVDIDHNLERATSPLMRKVCNELERLSRRKHPHRHKCAGVFGCARLLRKIRG